MKNPRGGLPSGPFHEGPPSALTSTKSALRGWIRAIHSATPITRLIGALIKDRAWRNCLNRGFDKDRAIEGGRECTGNTVDPLSGRGKAWLETDFFSSTRVGVLVSETSTTFSCETEIARGSGDDFPSRYL